MYALGHRITGGVPGRLLGAGRTFGWCARSRGTWAARGILRLAQRGPAVADEEVVPAGQDVVVPAEIVKRGRVEPVIGLPGQREDGYARGRALILARRKLIFDPASLGPLLALLPLTRTVGQPLAQSLAPALSRVPHPGMLGGCELGLLAVIGSSSLAIKGQGIKGLKGPIWRGGSRGCHGGCRARRRSDTRSERRRHR